MLKTEQQSRLAENFTKALEESKVTPKSIADACDITEQAVSNWKRSGKIASRHLPKISTLVGWSVSRLLTGHEPATSTAVAANEPNVFEVLTEDELSLLGDFRILIDEDREELRALISDRARRARAYLDKVAVANGIPLRARSIAETKAVTTTKTQPGPRLKQQSLLDES